MLVGFCKHIQSLLLCSSLKGPEGTIIFWPYIFCRPLCTLCIFIVKYRKYGIHDVCSHNIYGLVQEKHNSSALAMELCLSCTNLSLWALNITHKLEFFKHRWRRMIYLCVSDHGNVFLPLSSTHDIMTQKDFHQHWPFMRGIHQSPMDFLPKRPVVQIIKGFFVISLNELLN